MNAQTLGCTSRATMEDLESAISSNVIQQPPDAVEDDIIQIEIPQNVATVSCEGASSTVKGNESEIESISSFWPPKIDEFILVLLEDGFYIGQVQEVEKERVFLNYMVPKSTGVRELWIWPDRQEGEWVEGEYILEIYPSLRINNKLSTRRKVVYELLNEEIINVLISYS